MKIQATRLIDGLSDEALSNVVLEIGETVTGISEGAAVDAGADHYTVMPGLIDAHAHLSLSQELFEWWRNERPDATYALETLRNAQQQLRCGVTTVRDLGSIRDVVQQVRDAINSGVVQGPRIYTSGRWLCITGGHGAIYGHEADGPDGFRSAARKEIAAGADLIKLMATAGGLAEEGHDPNTTQVSDEELAEIRKVTGSHRVPLAIHAHSNEAIRLAAKHRASSVEHGTWLSDEAIAELIEADVTLVPTVYTYQRQAPKWGGIHSSPEQAELSERIMDVKMPWLEKAVKAGVKIAAGTDGGAPGTDHGVVGDEMAQLVRLGLSNMQAIKAGTFESGRLVTGGERGTLKDGAPADILIVRGNPLDDITALKNVVCVIKDGAVVHGEIPAELAVAE